MNTISNKLESQYKDVAAKADLLFKKTVEFVQDPDVRTCFALAANHGFRLDKMPNMTPEIQAMQLALESLQGAEKGEDKEKAREIQSAPDPEVIDVVAEEVQAGDVKVGSTNLHPDA